MLEGMKLWEAGWRNLVSVAPPGATISANSKLDPSQLGKAPGRFGLAGWSGYAWASYVPKEKDVVQWDAAGANIGLLASSYPAVDIDSEDLVFVNMVYETVLAALGPSFLRVGRRPRVLLPYRTEEPFAKIAIMVRHNGLTHLVEVLGDGQQYLVAGMHPSGTPYRWQKGMAGLHDISPEDLSLITRDDVVRLMQHIEADVRLAYPTAIVTHIGSSGATNDPVQEGLLAPGMEALADVVSRLRNPDEWGWHQYVQVGYAVKAAAGEHERAGYDIWSDWAGRWEAEGHDPDLDERNWDTFKGPFRIGYQWLRDAAEDQPSPDRAPLETGADDFAGFVTDDPVFPLLTTLLRQPHLLDPPESVLPYFAFRGRLTILAGLHKSGKSTMMAHGASAMSRGEPFLREPLEKGRTIWVGLEEAVGDAVRRFSDLQTDPFSVRLSYNPPDGEKLPKYLEHIATQWPADLMVLDSLTEYARRVHGAPPDDGDNAAWAKVVRPLVQFSRDHDIALVVLHHARRSDGKFRGAGEIAAASDALLEVRESPENPLGPFRFITGKGRWAIEPFTLIMRENGDYDVAAPDIDIGAAILDVVRKQPGVSRSEVYRQIGKRRGAVVAEIERMLEVGALINEGSEVNAELHEGITDSDFILEEHGKHHSAASQQ